jgi:thioredoxin 1
MLTELSKESFNDIIMTSKNLSIVQFKAEWNGACQIMEAMYLELSKTYKKKVSFFSVDAEKESSLYEQYGFKELPAILFFKNGELVDYATGLTSRDILITKIEKALAPLN